MSYEVWFDNGKGFLGGVSLIQTQTESTDVDGAIPKGTSKYKRGTTEEKTCELVLMDGVTKSCHRQGDQ